MEVDDRKYPRSVTSRNIFSRFTDSTRLCPLANSLSFNRDFRGPEEDDNPFSLDNTNDPKEASSSESDSEESGAESDESDGFGGKISNKKSTKTPQEEAKEDRELAESMGSTNLSSPSATKKPSAPAVPSGSGSGGGKGLGLGERKVVKSADEVAQARAAKKVEKKPTAGGSDPKNLNKGAPVQMSRRER